MKRGIIGLALLAWAGIASADGTMPVPRATVIVQQAPAADWQPIADDDLLVMDLAGGRRVEIALAPAFAPLHVANIRTLARAHWWDGLAIDRVQDGYVTQWGDADETKPLAPGVVAKLPAEYARPAAGLDVDWLAYRDTYADRVGAVGAFPVAGGGDSAWLVHCYGMVGAGRDLNPDTGTGAELYTVIAQPARGLDRNIALVGRVVAGMEALTALPRGTGEMGFYNTPAERTGISQVRLASEMPAAGRPRFEVLRPGSASYQAWVAAKASRQDSFFLHAPGAVGVCEAMPPVRARR